MRSLMLKWQWWNSMPVTKCTEKLSHVLKKNPYSFVFGNVGVRHSSQDSAKSSLTSLQDMANHIQEKCHNVLVMAGAGLSTPSGIPDFRSPGTGLYYNLQRFKLPYPEAIFEIDYFTMDQRPFMTLAQELYPGEKYRPNLAHYFIRMLHEKGKLLRIYTQNIDGLERLSGIPDEKLVEAHGTFSASSCIQCSTKYDPEETKKTILSGLPMRCTHKKCRGLVKPDIVFFGEELPPKFWLFERDVQYADFLLVIGTSLEVYPFAMIANEVQHDIPRLLINKHLVGSIGERKNDGFLSGDLIESITSFAKEIGWHNDLKNLFDKCESAKK